LIEKKQISPEFIDVFCEKGVFSRESARKILEAGTKIGLKGHFHGDMMNFMDSATIPAEVENISAITHLEYVDQIGIETLAKTGTVAIMAPTIQYALKLKIPPVRDMVEKGVVVALG
jgi:imidazolonepropionase